MCSAIYYKHRLSMVFNTSSKFQIVSHTVHTWQTVCLLSQLLFCWYYKSPWLKGERNFFLVYYSEGYSQSWQGRHDITQSRHGGRVKRLAFHIAFTLRKQRVNRKLDQPIKSQGLPPVTTCFFQRVSLLKVPQPSKQRISWGLSAQT